MPREQINHPDLSSKERQIELRKADPFDGLHDYEPWNEASLHVGWFADNGYGWIQLGLEVDVEYARMALASPNGEREDRTVMWTPTLTAHEIDKLIGTLKRAKRKALRKGPITQ